MFKKNQTIREFVLNFAAAIIIGLMEPNKLYIVPALFNMLLIEIFLTTEKSKFYS